MIIIVGGASLSELKAIVLRAARSTEVGGSRSVRLSRIVLCHPSRAVLYNDSEMTMLLADLLSGVLVCCRGRTALRKGTRES